MGVDVGLTHEKEVQLFETYRREFEASPDWAFPVAPPIPFVGDHYPKNGGGVLVYASAENLGYTWPKGMREWDLEIWQTHIGLKSEAWPWFRSAERQMCRSRLMYKDGSKGNLVHIEPINNGSLLLAARHAISTLKLAPDLPNNATQLLRHIAVANPGKFSIRSMANSDYASKPRFWPDSLPYIQHDMSVLDPAIVILPKTILATLWTQSPSLKELFKRRTLLPNYQITALMIRRNIRPILIRKGATEPSPFNNPAWPLTRGAERWGMEYYLQWLDVVAKDWVRYPTL